MRDRCCGRFGSRGEEPEVCTAQKHKVTAGLHCASSAYARQAIGWGFQFVTILSDTALLANGAKQVLAEMRAGGGAKIGKPTGLY